MLLRYVQNREERRKILQACHVDKTSGHMGRTRTLYRIKERFMWHGMVQDVNEMVWFTKKVHNQSSIYIYFISQLSKCDVCQRTNMKLTMATPQLNPIPVKAPWYMVGIDFVGPVSPVAEDGSRFILTITDYFTKWADAIATPDKSASSVATALFKVLFIFLIVVVLSFTCFIVTFTQLFMRMGIPRVILSDNGREFDNNLDSALADLLGLERRLTTPYHPQVNPNRPQMTPHNNYSLPSIF